MEWIRVEDGIPSDRQEVWVYGVLETESDYDIHKATFFKKVWHTNTGETTSEFWESYWGHDFTSVTHWMPLPEPPKDSNEVDQ